LSIFPDDVNIPLEAIRRLWNVRGELNFTLTKELCRKLFRLSLLLDYDLSAGTIRLHDVIREYLRSNPQLDLPSVNKSFLDAFRPTSIVTNQVETMEKPFVEQ